MFRLAMALGLAAVRAVAVSDARGCDLYAPFALRRAGGNFSLDPLFCDTAGGDFGLMTGSPCLPDNNACHAAVGARSEGCGPVAMDPMTWARVKAAYR